jgi:hypothetical protein
VIWLGDPGQGCDHCVPGHPIVYVLSRAGPVSLCLECFLLWFPGRGSDWFEQRHLPFRDHLRDALKRALEGQKQAPLWARPRKA